MTPAFRQGCVPDSGSNGVMKSLEDQPALDLQCRASLARAAGQDHLAWMTDLCMKDCVAVLAGSHLAASHDEAAEQLHRAAGGAAVVGLTRLCHAMRRMEDACRQGVAPADLDGLRRRAEQALADTRGALAGGGVAS